MTKSAHNPFSVKITGGEFGIAGTRDKGIVSFKGVSCEFDSNQSQATLTLAPQSGESVILNIQVSPRPQIIDQTIKQITQLFEQKKIDRAEAATLFEAAGQVYSAVAGRHALGATQMNSFTPDVNDGFEARNTASNRLNEMAVSYAEYLVSNATQTATPHSKPPKIGR